MRTDLTDVQRDILQLLADGAMITRDRMNMPHIGDRDIQPQTLLCLTDNGWITKRDPSRAITARGNGYVISDNGRLALECARAAWRTCDGCSRPARSLTKIGSGQLVCKACLAELRPEKATEAQLAYAEDLGIQFPPDISKADMCWVLDLHIKHPILHDIPAGDELRQIAQDFRIPLSMYLGQQALRILITDALKEEGRACELAAWFAYHVVRDLYKGARHCPQAWNPSSPVMRAVAQQLAQDARAMKSIRRYSSQDLERFGEWPGPDGYIQQGGSRRTLGYARAAELLRQAGA